MADQGAILHHCSGCNIRTKTPCTLECSHTLCSPCILESTEQQIQDGFLKIQDGRLFCPFCEQKTPVPDPEQPIENWPEQLTQGTTQQGHTKSIRDQTTAENKPEQLAQSIEQQGHTESNRDQTTVETKPDQLAQSITQQDHTESSRNQTTAETPCDLCKEEGMNIPATVSCKNCMVTLCSACLKAHRRNPASRHHDIIDVTEHVKDQKDNTLSCSKHNDEAIRFYCKDCKQPLCQTCCKQCHKNCRNIITLDSFLPEMQTALRDNKEILTQIMSNQQSRASERQTQLDDLENMKETFKSQIRSLCEMIIGGIRRKENELSDELEHLTENTMGNLTSEIKHADMSRHIALQKSLVIEDVLESGNQLRMFETYLSCQQGVVQLVNALVTDPEKKADDISSIQLHQDPEKIQQLLDQLCLGKFEVLVDKRETGRDLELELSEVLQLKVIGDESQPNPTDVVTLTVHGESVIVVADWGDNKSIKSFYKLDERSCSSSLTLDNGPYGLTRSGDNEIAVTVPNSKQIVLVHVNPELKKVSTLPMRKEYWGITALTSSTLAVGCQKPSCVDVIDLTGTILKTLRPHGDNGFLIKYPNFLTLTSQGHLIISDCGTKAVVCVSKDGDVIFNYKPTGEESLKSPRGIAVYGQEVLVVDFSRHVIVRLTETGEHSGNVKCVEEDVQYPHGLCVHGEDRLYLSCYSEGLVKTFTCRQPLSNS